MIIAGRQCEAIQTATREGSLDCFVALLLAMSRAPILRRLEDAIEPGTDVHGPVQSRRNVLEVGQEEIIMAPTILPVPTSGFRLGPVELRRAPLFCFALLTISCALASFAFACATPFAAFAVVAAAMLPLRPALLAVTGAWFVNQAIGFGVLHYPIDTNTILWGFAIGIAALIATVMSAAILGSLPRNRTPLVLTFALISAYCTYELVIFAATSFLGGAGSFTFAIVARLGSLSALWLLGLVAVCEVVRLQPLRRRAVS
jgi:hypothetical protein